MTKSYASTSNNPPNIASGEKSIRVDLMPKYSLMGATSKELIAAPINEAVTNK